jgi:hypothetical protein
MSPLAISVALAFVDPAPSRMDIRIGFLSFGGEAVGTDWGRDVDFGVPFCRDVDFMGRSRGIVVPVVIMGAMAGFCGVVGENVGGTGFRVGDARFGEIGEADGCSVTGDLTPSVSVITGGTPFVCTGVGSVFGGADVGTVIIFGGDMRFSGITSTASE